MSLCLYKNCTHCDTSMIDITGLCTSSDVTNIISNNPYWIQTFINETLTLPEASPNLGSITSMDIEVTVLRTQVVKTPVSAKTNMEDIMSTGRTIIFEGETKQTLVYTSDNPLQPFHSVTFYVPFTSYIVVPKEITFINSGGTTVVDDPININFSIYSCLKYTDICLIDTRHLRTNLLVLFYAVPQSN